MRFILFIFFAALLSMPAIIYGQQQYNFKFQTYTAKEGLVHNYAKKCRQDSKGFLWIITQHGLSRFDGLNFKNFEHSNADSNSLPENDLEDIAIDRDDNIWLSYKSGLCFYNSVANRFKKISEGSRYLQSYVITYDARLNCIWSVNFTSYSKIDCASKTIKTVPFVRRDFNSNNNNRIGFLLLDSKNRLWIPYARSRYHCIDLSSSEQYFHDEVVQPTSFYEDDQHNIWMTTWHRGFRKVNTDSSVHHFEMYGDPYLRISATPYEYISKSVTQSNAVGGKNILWVVKYDDGIFLFDKTTGSFVQQFYYNASNRNGIASDFNEYIFTDRNDNIWICTWNGITEVNKLEQQFISRELPELKDQLTNWVTGFADDPNNKEVLWMSVCGMGLVKYDKPSGKILHRYGFYYNDAQAVLTGNDFNYDWRWTTDLWTDSKKQIWSTTYAGLFKIKNGTVSKLELKNDRGGYIYPKLSKEIGNEGIWVVGRGGIFNVNAADEKYVFYGDERGRENIFYDIEKLDNSNMVLASDSGIKIFNTVTHRFTPLAETGFQSAAERSCRCIEVIDNKIYIGSLAGLRVYDVKDKTSIAKGKNEGIDKVDQYRLRQDADRNLWIITSHGLFKYTPQHLSFEKFTTNDGLYNLNEDDTYFFQYAGNFYIGYRMACTQFDSYAVNINTVKANPVITDIFINGKRLDESGPGENVLQLSYEKNEITFNYTAADFTNTDKITFMYRLEGHDTAWINAGTRRTVNYNNLLPGNYVFKLKAANSSGLWNEAITSVTFYIKPAFWQTWWFRLLAITLACSLIYIVYRYRLKQLKRSYEIRSSISRNLHDEIGATLSSINIYSDVARNKTAENDTRQLANKMYDASAKAMESMSDIVWYVNPANDMLENMLVRMREYALPLLEAKNINVIFTADEKVETVKLTMQQRQHFYLIFKEAVNNILKYAGAKNVCIEIVKDGNEIRMMITDDGRGFVIGINAAGNGLKNMQFRAASVNGGFSIESADGKGCSVKLNFPIT